MEYVFQETKQPLGTLYKERVQNLEISYLKVITDVCVIQEGRVVFC